MVDVVANFKFLLDVRVGKGTSNPKTAPESTLCSVPLISRFASKGTATTSKLPNRDTGGLTSLQAAASGRAIRRSAAIPDSRRRPTAEPAGGATGSRSRPPPRCAQAGHRGKSECLRQTTADAHWVG